MSTYQVPCPSWQVMIPQPAFFFFFEDMFHYFLFVLAPCCPCMSELLMHSSMPAAHQLLHMYSTNIFTNSTTSIPHPLALLQNMHILLKSGSSKQE